MIDTVTARHLDADGNGPLVGVDCPDCLRREVAHYRCPVCGEVFAVPGVFRWSWQGRGHWHNPDDGDAFRAALNEHRRGHDGKGAFVPVKS